MAEFTEIWESWKRMCQYQNDLGEGGCMECPLTELECNSEYPKDQIHYDGKAIEEIIAAWAADHPDPVYPTWGEWLESAHIVNPDPDAVCNQHLLKAWYYDSYIPADIAEKLGIEPKEGI